MLSCVSTRIRSIKLGTKETKTFGTASKFYTVLLIFQMLDISDALRFRMVLFLDTFLSEIKIIQKFLEVI